jgi:hypothetical protein
VRQVACSFVPGKWLAVEGVVGVLIARRISMKYLLTGVAVIAALAFSAPVEAQPANPSGGNAVGTPGPNPGGPGLTPYSTGAAPPEATPSGRMSTGGRRTSGERIPAIMPETSPPPSASNTTSATPPMHHHARRGSHHKVAGRPQLTGSSADQLNQEELARLQAGSTSMPTAPEMSPGTPSAPGMPANPNQMNRMSTGGRATSGGPR